SHTLKTLLKESPLTGDIQVPFAQGATLRAAKWPDGSESVARLVSDVARTEEQARLQEQDPSTIRQSPQDATVRAGVSQKDRLETELMQEETETVAYVELDEVSNRRIAGTLITYTWRAEGQLFVIREGKNFIGRGDISSEAVPRPCDIQIPQDLRLSGEHALIL